MWAAIAAFIGKVATTFFLNKFWELLEKGSQWLIAYLEFKRAEKKMVKKVKAKIKEIKSDKDRMSRIKRMHDYLNN